MGTIDDELAKLQDSNLKPEDIARYNAENTAPPADNTAEIDNKRNEIIGKYRNTNKLIGRISTSCLVLGLATFFGGAGIGIYKIDGGHYRKSPEVVEYLNMGKTLSNLELTTISAPELPYKSDSIRDDLRILYDDNIDAKKQAFDRARQIVSQDIEIKEKEEIVARYLNEIKIGYKVLTYGLSIGIALMIIPFGLAILNLVNLGNRNKKLRKLEELTQQ